MLFKSLINAWVEEALEGPIKDPKRIVLSDQKLLAFTINNLTFLVSISLTEAIKNQCYAHL
jgi:hypothetical protein